MAIERLVANASRLIALFRSSQTEILSALCSHVAVPDTVWCEVTAGGHEDAAASGLVQADWLKQLAVAPVDPVVQAWDDGGAVACAGNRADAS